MMWKTLFLQIFNSICIVGMQQEVPNHKHTNLLSSNLSRIRMPELLTCPSSRSDSTVHRDPLFLPLCAPWAESDKERLSTSLWTHMHTHTADDKNKSLRYTLLWISTLMVSTSRLVLRTLMNSIRGRMLMPCRETKNTFQMFKMSLALHDGVN